MISFRNRFVKDFFALSLFSLLAIVMTYPLIFHLSNHVPSDLGDPLMKVWAMAWNLHKLGIGLANFWDGNIFFPHHGALAYSDYVFAQSLFASPIVAISHNFILAFNILFIFSFFLSGIGMFYLVLHLTQSRWAAVVSGLIFAFFPYRFAHISHLELLYLGWLPLCFLFLHKFFENPSAKNLVGAGVFFILQSLSCAYYGLYLALFAGVFVLYFAVKKGLVRHKVFWLKLTIGAAAIFLILLPLFFPFIRAHQNASFGRPLWEVTEYSAQLQHFLAVPPWNRAWGWLTGRIGAQEWQLFPGIVPLFLAGLWWFKRPKAARALPKKSATKAFLLWDCLLVLYLVYLVWLGISGGFSFQLGFLEVSSRHLQGPSLIFGFILLLRIALDPSLKSRLRRTFQVQSLDVAERFYFSAMIVSWLFSLGPIVKILNREIIPGPYLLLYKYVPGFMGLRVPARFAAVMMLALSVLCGWSVARLAIKWRSAKKKWLGVTAVSALIIFEFASIPLPLAEVKVGQEIPLIYTDLRNLPAQCIVIELPLAETSLDQSSLYMYYSIHHWRRLVNGTSGFYPPGYIILSEAMEYFPSERTIDLLNNLGVDYILVHTGLYQKRDGTSVIENLKKYQHEVSLLKEVQGDFLYRLLRPFAQKEQTEAFSEVGERSRWRASASLNSDKAELALDGNPLTGWSTKSPQKEGDFFSLDLGSIQKVEKVELSLAEKPLEFPRGYRLEGSADGASWSVLAEDPDYFPELQPEMIEDYSKYKVEIPFASHEVRYLRLILTRAHKDYRWSIQEISCKSR